MSQVILGHKTLKFIKGYYYAPRFDAMVELNNILENIISGTNEPLDLYTLDRIQSSNHDFTDINNQLEEIISGREVISFTIDETQYYAEDGMTWLDWINSEYNIDGYEKSFGLGDLPIQTPGGNGEVRDPNTEWFVCPDDTIINKRNYYTVPY